jgi:UDP-perosamine 4-acetyltransferase
MMPESIRPMNLILVGGGGHAKVVADATYSAGHSILGFLDDASNAVLAQTGVEHLGRLDQWPIATSLKALLVPAIGHNQLRHQCVAQWIESTGGKQFVATVVHASAIVSPSATLGAGTFCSANAVVNAGAVIGRACIVNTSAVVEHDCVIGDGAHIAPRVALGGHVTVGSQSLIGIGAVVRPGIQIGNGCTIGAGAVVVNDIPDGVTVVGNPARASEVVARHR